MARAGQVTIDISAGTARFVAEIDTAKAKLREIGSTAKEAGAHAVSGVQATSGALRVLEGGITNNLRAAERFTANVLGLGPLLQKAFPVVGVIAFAGILGEVGGKVTDFFKEIAQGPERVRGSWRDLNAGLQLTNDALGVTNARLENEIAKLEGKHQNTLKLALVEAREAADKLADSLQKDLKSVDDLVRKESSSNFTQFFKSLVGGGAGTQDIAKQLGGETGQGGFKASIFGITDPATLQAAYDKEIAVMRKAMDDAKTALDSGKIMPFVYGLQGETIQGDMKARLETLQGVVRDLEQERSYIDAQTKNTSLEGRLAGDQAKHDNAQADRPFANRMATMGAQIDAVKAKLEAIGKPEAAQLIAKAFGDAQKAIVEVNDALARHNEHLSNFQKWGILTAQQTIVNAEASAEWKAKLTEANTSIDQHIESQQMLTAAIGKGYEATRQANVETRVMQELGQHFGDTAWMAEHQAEVEALRGRLEAEHDAQHATAQAESVQKLNEQIDLEREMARAQAQGAEAVRQAANTVRESYASWAGATVDETNAQTALYAAEQANLSADHVSKIQEKIEATQRLTTAILAGADAVRRANLENSIAEAKREGDRARGTALPGVGDYLGVGGIQGPVEGALRNQDSANHAKELASLAVQTDRVKAIQEQIDKLQEIKATLGDTVAVDAEISHLYKEQDQALAEQLTGIGRVSDAMQAVFLEMQASAKTTGQIIADSLKQAVEGTENLLSKNLADLMTGDHKKGEWSKSFKQLSGGLAQSSIKMGLDKILGGKADGSSVDRALWVRMAGGQHPTYGPSDAQLGVPGASGDEDAVGGGGAPPLPKVGPFQKVMEGLGTGLGIAAKIFGGGGGVSMGPSMQSLGGLPGAMPNTTGFPTFDMPTFEMPEFAGAFATGGDIDPGNYALVGEDGPELFAPKTGGSVIPFGKTGSGDIHIHYGAGAIDARGAALGVEGRVASAIEASHNAAVARSVAASNERDKRRPQRPGR